MGEHHRVELLAPAGNVEGFYGAVHAGADAVYLAGERFGARAYAENFTINELVACIRYAHLLGRKVYLAVNTLLKDHELEELYDYLFPFQEAGVDAVIVQDLGVLHFVREHFKGLKLHASTQMTLCSSYGVQLLKSMGVSRIVPARELSLRELVRIKESTGIEIEAFIHGAMCYCYSGQCLFSSILGGRSGNRGRCAQPCRLPYSICVDGEDCHEIRYPMSLKDMCTIEHLPQLIEAGIDSFKIEGRMKKPEYAAGVTAVYRRYIDKYYDMREKKGSVRAAEEYCVEEKDSAKLHALYIRSEVQDGYYFRHNGREMITVDSPAYSGNDDALLKKIREELLESRLKMPITIRAIFQAGQPAEIILQWQAVKIMVKGEPVETARKQPITAENIRNQLGKLGESAFQAETIEISVGEDCFYPLREINALRRTAVAELERQIFLARGYGDMAQAKKDADGAPKVHQIMKREELPKTGYAFLACTNEQMEMLSEWLSAEGIDAPMRVYVEGDLLIRNPKSVGALCRRLSAFGEVYVALPYILREPDRDYLEQLYENVSGSCFFQGFLVRSMDGLGFLESKGTKAVCRADAGLYVWNRSAMQELGSRVAGFCLPYELKASEQRVLLGNLPCEKIVYSRIPMMITSNCLFHTADKCRGRGEKLVSAKHMLQEAGSHVVHEESNSAADRYHAVLKDRYRMDFPVVADCLHCMNIIYNTVPLSLHQELSKWRGSVDLRMDFTLETAPEVWQILDTFLKGAAFRQGEYTTGHEKRGAE